MNTVAFNLNEQRVSVDAIRANRKVALNLQKTFSHATRHVFVQWLKNSIPDIDLQTDIGPSGWENSVSNIYTTKNPKLIALLSDPSTRPAIVKDVGELPDADGHN